MDSIFQPPPPPERINFAVLGFVKVIPRNSIQYVNVSLFMSHV